MTTANNPPRVLLVDDDPLVRECVARLLDEGSFSVVSCGEAREALASLRSTPVDAVLSDVRMPGLSGLDLLGEVRSFDPQIPVLLMTGYADVDMAVTAIQKGVFDFILKPYDPSRLLHSVEKAVEFKRLRQIETRYRQELEQRVEEATRELKASHEKMLQGEKMASVGQLAAGVAHEINNPVGFITSNLGTLNRYAGRLTGFVESQARAIAAHCPAAVQEEIAGERRRLKLAHILEDLQPLIDESLEGTDRVKKLVQNLKTFSRVDNAEFILTDINEGLESTINICWNELKYVATLHKEYGELPEVRGYPQQLNQVFMNLLVNAAHSIETKGEITLRSWHEDGFVFVSVADTGCGMPQERLEQIFEPFFTTKESGKGTGLGLSISLEIVRKHQGEIRVRSVPGKGTEFTVMLPVEQQRPA